MFVSTPSCLVAISFILSWNWGGGPKQNGGIRGIQIHPIHRKVPPLKRLRFFPERAPGIQQRSTTEPWLLLESRENTWINSKDGLRMVLEWSHQNPLVSCIQNDVIQNYVLNHLLKNLMQSRRSSLSHFASLILHAHLTGPPGEMEASVLWYHSVPRWNNSKRGNPEVHWRQFHVEFLRLLSLSFYIYIYIQIQ